MTPARRTRGILPLLATALVAAACASSENNDSPPAAAPTTSSGASSTTAAPQAVDRLTVAAADDVGPLNIFASHEEPITELVYDKLLAPSPYVAEPKPWLATAVRMVDPATWEADLRTDVSWHDGERFTAQDVVF